ncbi:hypothetical protein OUZ56_021900 [Daphnia magna]|uniref:Uncharacterized protein n=1 Tax=Daphnia magna TaxID=35525 RepID=A0ABR0AUT0_9CRUS|nr:hypothetical protein OUZ56_021900 [Daphnia magna]
MGPMPLLQHSVTDILNNTTALHAAIHGYIEVRGSNAALFPHPPLCLNCKSKGGAEWGRKYYLTNDRDSE